MEAEEDEPDIDAAVRCAATLKPKTLNEDPYNVFAEDLAMEMCKLGFEVAAELLETDLVFTSCGSLVSGTPDGGFRDHQGLLRLVQVVRVPLLPEMDEDEVADILYDTVLTKVVKSQTWMKETATLPHDFTIFCWLPPVGAYRACLEETDALLWTDALMWNLRAGGWPFSLVIQVPEEPGKLFPRNFGFRNFNKEKKDYAPALSYFLNTTDFDPDDDDDVIFTWDDTDLDNTDDTSGPDVGHIEPAVEVGHVVERLQCVLLAIEWIQANLERQPDLQGSSRARMATSGLEAWPCGSARSGRWKRWKADMEGPSRDTKEQSLQVSDEDFPSASPKRIEAWEVALGDPLLSNALDTFQLVRHHCGSRFIKGSDIDHKFIMPEGSSQSETWRGHLECLHILMCY